MTFFRKRKKSSSSPSQKDMFLELVQLVHQASLGLKDAIESDCSQLETVFKAEARGDTLRDLIIDDLSREKSARPLVLDKLKLVRRLDDVLDACERAAYNIRVYSSAVTEDIKQDLVAIATDVTDMANKLSSALTLLYDDFSQAKEQVEQLEQFRDHAIRVIYDLKQRKFASELTWKEYYALDLIASRLREIMQYIKGVGEIIWQIAVKYVD